MEFSESARLNGQSPRLAIDGPLTQFGFREGKQIERTEAESQQIVAQRPLSCVQYLVPFKSYTKDLSLPIFELVLRHRLPPRL